VDVVRGLEEFGCDVDIFDPWAIPAEVEAIYGLKSIQDIDSLEPGKYNAIVLAVAHARFRDMDIAKYKNGSAVVFDIKGILPRNLVDDRL